LLFRGAYLAQLGENMDSLIFFKKCFLKQCVAFLRNISQKKDVLQRYMPRGDA